MNCALTQWKDVSVPSSLPGLLWNGKKFTINPEYFACCKGQGLRWDASLQVARSCRIQGRKRKIDSLLQQFEEAWPGAAFPSELSLQDRNFFLLWLKRMQTQQVHYGYLASCKRDGGTPGAFWLFAAIASWRFGFSSHVFSIGRSKDHEIIPLSVPANEYPLIYFLDNVNELWKPRYKEQVSTIINWCEQSEVPLWMEIREAADSNLATSEYVDLKEAFRTYISKMKSRPVLNWLDEECLSRLLRVCSKGVPVNFLKETVYARMDT